MAVTTRPTESPAASARETDGPPYVQRRLHVDEYHRMIETAILDEDDKVELLEGVLVEMSPQGEPHARVITRLTRALVLAAGDGFMVRPQVPLTLGDFSEPEPDLAVVRVSDAQSRTDHPRTALLVVEVSGESLRKDRGIKAAIYASAGIPNYWIINVDGASVEVYGDPDASTGRYRRLVTLQGGATLEVEGLSRLSLSVAALFD